MIYIALENRRMPADLLNESGQKPKSLQKDKDAFVERIEGDYFNVVGLPVGLVKKLLRDFGVVF